MILMKKINIIGKVGYREIMVIEFNSSNSMGKEQRGISLDFFIRNSTFMKGIQPDIGKRIVMGLGLDAASTNTKINWENYVILYCMLEKLTITG